MTPDELALFIHRRGVSAFYTGRAWRKVRKKVLMRYKNECQDCKAQGKYKRATVVHHEKPIKSYPKLALSEYYFDQNGYQKPNLIPLCRECHEKREGRLETWGKVRREKSFFNKERW